MQYLNLNTLKIENTNTSDKIMSYFATIPYEDLETITDQWPAIRYAVENGLQSIERPTRPHLFQYELEVKKELSVESFESAIKLILAAFFEALIEQPKKGRPRERRLDVPEELKQANCNMSLLKRAINYKTIVDKFQIEIRCGDLNYNLVGVYYE